MIDERLTFFFPSSRQVTYSVNKFRRDFLLAYRSHSVLDNVVIRSDSHNPDFLD